MERGAIPMTMPDAPANWSRLKEIVADVLEAPLDERAGILERACEGDTALLTEARLLIAAYDNSTGVIDRRTDAYLGLGGPDLLSLSGQRIGKYRLTRVIAEGAMAAVYEAQQPNPQRAVALKLFRTNMTVVDAHQRFRREAQALARLQHPNIARIYEASLHQGADGRAMPFIAMEYVDGLPLSAYARKHQLPRQQRIELLIKVAQAVHAAHQQAVIHRDLKPANVLVDKAGEPKVLDFGIARIVGEELETYTWQTTAGVLLGTPGYMSPEQAKGVPHGVDVRSDVWSLGVMLYELVADQLPIDVRGASIAEVLRRIEDAQPPPISSIDRSLKGDLETIVATAIAPDKSERYPSALALAEDLQRYLRHEPIAARPPTTWYVLRKFASRNRGKIAAAAVIVGLLIGGIIASSIGFVRASRQRDRALVAERRTQSVNKFLQEMLSAPDVSGGGKRDVTVIEALQNAEEKIASTFKNHPLTEADVRGTIGWTYFSLSRYADAERELRRMVELLTRELGPDDPRTLDWRNNFAIVLRWSDKADEAAQIIQQDLPRAREQLGGDHPTTLALLENHAGIAADRGDFSTAVERYRELIDRCREALGPDHAHTQTAENNLAWALMESGRSGEAVPVLRALLERRQRLLGRMSHATIITRHNLAQALLTLDRTGEAEPIIHESLEDARSLFGPEHDNTLSILGTLADVSASAGRFDESAETCRFIADARARAFGPLHDSTLRAMSNYAVALLQADRPADAEHVARRACEAAEKGHGNDSLIVWRLRGVLGLTLSELGRGAEAEPLLERVVARLTELQDANHPLTRNAQNHLAACYVEQGQYEQAVELIRRCLSNPEATPVPAREAALKITLARALAKLGKTDEAEKLLLESWSVLSAGDAIDRKMAARRTAEFYDAIGKPDVAEGYRTTTRPAAAP